jgi:hypothetical protein
MTSASSSVYVRKKSSLGKNSKAFAIFDQNIAGINQNRYFLCKHVTRGELYFCLGEEGNYT